MMADHRLLTSTTREGILVLTFTDSLLTAAFEWAKETALSYAHEDDPVGDWYEAALPDREAFCMRDVAHQSTGASVLGLSGHTRNMLHKFAVNISESKDYCSYWEINRYDQPAPVDYENDDDFWYNLPANFDVVHACYRQFLWTGDSSYITDREFMNFYSLSLNEYIVAYMVTGFTVETLPIKIFNSLRYGYTPVMASVAVAFVLLAALIFGLIGRFGDLPKLLGAMNPEDG